MNRYQRNQMKAAGFKPQGICETPLQWARRIHREGYLRSLVIERIPLHLVERAMGRALRPASPFEVDWDKCEKTRKHCEETERD